jgi:peptidoglycan/xylan/chitin deacetylase (PgdA/CDA1 family)
MSDVRDISAGNQPAADSRWRPAPAIRLSAAIHLGGLAAVAFDPLSWPYVAAALVANHAALGLAGMLPRSTALGPNLNRLPEASASRGEIALTFDDGPDPTSTLPILDLLDRYQAKASFFCIGCRAARYPEIVKEIALRGHGVENHSNRHSKAFAGYTIGRLRSDIEAAQEVLAALAGRPPTFFRAPMGLRNPLLDPVLARLGLIYVSWTRRGLDTVDRNRESVLARLVRELSAGDVLLLHDAAGAGPRLETAVAISVLPALMERIAAAGLQPVTLRTACRETAV